jgi:hypothetical protein
MSVPTIFDLCKPRPDVLAGTSSDSDFAADLSHVVRGTGGPLEYSNPQRFFANTYPTRGLKSLLANVCTRLSSSFGMPLRAEKAPDFSRLSEAIENAIRIAPL